MLNHIVLMGRLTRDPELRYTGSNIPVASFTVAVDRDFGKGARVGFAIGKDYLCLGMVQQHTDEFATRISCRT